MLRVVVACVLLPCLVSSLLDNSLNYQTFYSPVVPLYPGQVANTDARTPIEWISGPAAVRYFYAEVVDDTGRSVPLDEIYVHHWLIFSNLTTGFGNAGPCSRARFGTSQVFGIGAELRGTDYNLPAPYAILLDGSEQWTANLHFIRTDANVADVQKCIECHCYDGTPTHPHGGIGCEYDGIGCDDQSFCWSTESQNTTALTSRNYYLKYTVGWTTDLASAIPVEIFLMDVTAQHTTDCMVEYQVAAAPGTSTLETTLTLGYGLKIVQINGHQHIGGTNMTLSLAPPNGTFTPFCVMNTVYGSGETAGDERDYVTSISACVYSDPFIVGPEDTLKIQSYYTNRTLPGGHAEHEGVMGLIWLAAIKIPCDGVVSCAFGGQTGFASPWAYTNPQNSILESSNVNSLAEAFEHCESLPGCAAVSLAGPLNSLTFPVMAVYTRNSDNAQDVCSYCSSIVFSAPTCFVQTDPSASYGSCATCGYDSDPSTVAGPDSCVSCPAGFEIDVANSQLCTGYCVPVGTAKNPMPESMCGNSCLLCSTSSVWSEYPKQGCTCQSDSTKSLVTKRSQMMVAVGLGLGVTVSVFAVTLLVIRRRRNAEQVDKSRLLSSLSP